MDTAVFAPEKWRCDQRLRIWDEWEANKDMTERMTLRLQGVPAFLCLEDLVSGHRSASVTAFSVTGDREECDSGTGLCGTRARVRMPLTCATKVC